MSATAPITDALAETEAVAQKENLFLQTIGLPQEVIDHLSRDPSAIGRLASRLGDAFERDVPNLAAAKKFHNIGTSWGFTPPEKRQPLLEQEVDENLETAIRQLMVRGNAFAATIKPEGVDIPDLISFKIAQKKGKVPQIVLRENEKILQEVALPTKIIDLYRHADEFK